jgi:hypothetical protein
MAKETRVLSVKRILTLLLFMVLTLVSTNVLVLATQNSGSALREKGLMIETDVILGTAMKSTSPPSFSALKQSGFTIVGTGLSPTLQNGATLTEKDLKLIAKWIQDARHANIKTFLSVGWRLEPKTAVEKAIDYTQYAASLGVDFVHLDELLSRYHVSKAQLLSVFNAGLAINPNLQFIASEYVSENLQYVYSWTSEYPMVRVATDGYNSKAIIDLNMQLAQRYNKKPLSWLIFSKEGDFDCYKNLNGWLEYVKQMKIDLMFWEVDSWGTWQKQWQKVQGF